ncbi:succinate dehydrogenase, hydrophobic membrane anchor protein [Plastoroseomonas arctica]|uniref:Succinate dehydrogenase hydrophobic membrane anchor subunit n=1 Tax=Plastoroseomonas arctica TaxID=1509237 RepID=A0AAF1KKK7_9PROT|nr:succinate dehydrogenase, hydrophobic membrane anchor protein [Plastoroseomonas arctica]MBR0655349.1 succinate dehydrogenase, hydrophobic membrane anchor protein [Plastoroseomonas arctica]
MATPSLRSPLGRVRGLGSARSGTHHWWMQRVTSIALLPLTIWLVFALASLAGAGFSEAQVWVARPFNAVLLLAFLGAGFHHTAAGLQVVIEDYVKPDSRRIVVMLVVKGLCALLWLMASLAVLRIALR